jgi:hypothetical protein
MAKSPERLASLQVARTPSGYVAAPPSSMMNSRRFS